MAAAAAAAAAVVALAAREARGYIAITTIPPPPSTPIQNNNNSNNNNNDNHGSSSVTWIIFPPRTNWHNIGKQSQTTSASTGIPVGSGSADRLSQGRAGFAWSIFRASNMSGIMRG